MMQGSRGLNAHAMDQATASDKLRHKGLESGPLAGIPVLVNDSIDDAGLATSAGSIALQDNLPAASSKIVGKLEAAGAIVIGDTNVTELGGAFGPNMPQGYSSLGGQVLLPSDTNKTVGGSSGGSAAAVSIRIAPLAIGSEPSPDKCQPD